jgi:hypothetical protein
MSTVAPDMHCPLCHGTGKIGEEFCPCLGTEDDERTPEDDAPTALLHNALGAKH